MLALLVYREKAKILDIFSSPPTIANAQRNAVNRACLRLWREGKISSYRSSRLTLWGKKTPEKDPPAEEIEK